MLSLRFYPKKVHMSYSLQQVSQFNVAQIPIALLDSNRRSRFLMRTYCHLFIAVLLFVGIQVTLLRNGLAEPILTFLFGLPWTLILCAFIIVAWLASRTARQAIAQPAQYFVLFSFVIAESFLFLQLIYIVDSEAAGSIGSAVGITILGFLGLTAVVFVTRKDFSFAGSLLLWVGFSTLLLVVASWLFGFQLGTWFSVGMIVFAGGAILRDTSRVLRSYPEDRYVAAALELFASLALLFWYVLRMVMQVIRR